VQSLFYFPQNAVHFHDFIFFCSNKMFITSHALQYLPGHLKDKDHCVMAVLNTDRSICQPFTSYTVLPLCQSHPASYEHYIKTLLIQNELLH